MKNSKPKRRIIPVQYEQSDHTSHANSPPRKRAIIMAGDTTSRQVLQPIGI